MSQQRESAFASVGEVIRRERRLRGWNQRKLARLIGVNRSTLSRYEKGHQLPERAALDGILDAFGWDLLELARLLAEPVAEGGRDPAERSLAPSPLADPTAAAIAEPVAVAAAGAGLPLQAALIHGVAFADLQALLRELAERAVREALGKELDRRPEPATPPASSGGEAQDG